MTPGPQSGPESFAVAPDALVDVNVSMNNAFEVSGGALETPDFLRGGGEMGALMRRHDWSTSLLGPPWLAAAASHDGPAPAQYRAPHAAWGVRSSCLYNDAYRQSMGQAASRVLAVPRGRSGPRSGPSGPPDRTSHDRPGYVACRSTRAHHAPRASGRRLLDVQLQPD